MTHEPATAKADGNGEAVALPLGWRTAAIGEVCVDQTENRDPRKDPEAPFRYVDISSVDNQRKVIREARQLLGKEAPNRARQVIRTNDVLVATTRPNLNAVALVPPKLDNAICSTGFCVLRSNGNVEPEFLFAFAQTEEFVRGLSEIVKGALYPAVTDGQVRAKKLPVPPLPEQRRIAARLREQLAAVDQARAAVQAQETAARSLPIAHLRTLFQNAVAAKWPRKTVEEIAAHPLRTGLSKPGNALSTARCLTLSAVRNGLLDLSASKPTEVTEQEAKANALKPGVFYVVRGNGNIALVARGALAPNPMPYQVLFPDLLIEIESDPAVVQPAFLRWAWDSPEVRAALEARSMTSAGIYKINLGNLSTVQIPVPTLQAQQAIAAKCQVAADQITAFSRQVAHRKTALDHMPTALLREAFAGRN